MIANYTNLVYKMIYLDLIYSKENEYAFLEINPVGQFGMVSYLCNYHLRQFIHIKYK